MKNKHCIIFILTIATLLTSCSPAKLISVEPINKNFQISGTQDQLYIKANNWMVENFVNAESVIQFSDKKAGIVTGKYLLKRYPVADGLYGYEQLVYAIIKIQVKEGATKISIDPEDFKEGNNAYASMKYKYNKEIATQQITDLITNYENYMRTDTSTDW